jgi:hypothetical protein
MYRDTVLHKLPWILMWFTFSQMSVATEYISEEAPPQTRLLVGTTHIIKSLAKPVIQYWLPRGLSVTHIIHPYTLISQ